jgi:hypothetical protein
MKKKDSMGGNSQRHMIIPTDECHTLLPSHPDAASEMPTSKQRQYLTLNSTIISSVR